MYDELINKLRIGAKCFPGYKLYGYSKEPFRLMPEHLTQAADAIEELQKRKHGKWERNYDGIFYWWECSECHHDAWYDKEDLTNFCPNCGAYLRGDSNE